MSRDLVPKPPTSPDQKRRARRFIVLLGLVSLFADATYESARSILGQLLASLGASAASVGVIAGVGELLNNGLRVVSGHLADRTRRPWRITIFGFTINMLAVPLLALATTPFVAAAILFAERTGKAIRNPPRDAMLSNAARRVGRGQGFGVQEALGQIGAVIGPLLIGVVIARDFGYRFALGLLIVPASLALGLLLFTRRQFPHPIELEPPVAPQTDGRIPGAFWVFVVAASLIAAGYLDFALIAFSLVRDTPEPAARIPLFYALAMATQAIASLATGRAFDARPAAVLVLSCAVSIPVAALAFREGIGAILAAVVLWGLGLGAQKTVFKATIAGMIVPERRATAYGAFFAAFGFAWFLGSWLMGRLLDDARQTALIAFSVSCHVVALIVLVPLLRRLRP